MAGRAAWSRMFPRRVATPAGQEIPLLSIGNCFWWVFIEDQPATKWCRDLFPMTAWQARIVFAEFQAAHVGEQPGQAGAKESVGEC